MEEIDKLHIERRYLRETEVTSWYTTFHEYGIACGPTFRGISNLRAYHESKTATADIDLKPTKAMFKYGESRYVMHPATIDTLLQLAMIACHSGQIENVNHVYVPVAVEDMSLWMPDSTETGYSSCGIATGELRGSRGAYGRAQLFSESGQPLLDVGTVKCISFEGTRAEPASTKYPRDPFFRIAWKPDIYTLSNENAKAMFPATIALDIIAPVFEKGNKLATYLIVQFSALQKELPRINVPEHLEYFLTWIERCANAAKAGQLPCGREAIEASADRRAQVIDELSKELVNILEIQLVKRIYDHLPAILANTTSPLQVALQNGLLTDVYKSGIILSAAYPQLVNALDLIAHKKPQMRVLEIGAGTGGATRYAMKTLGGLNGSKRYKDYTFTDVTTSFLSPAEAEFSTCRNMIYKKLDIDINPSIQGFGSDYDLAIASQVLHTTRTMAETIRHTRRLLKPGGHLVMIEGTREQKFVGLVFGTFPDYWNGAQDGRVDSPFLNKEQWHHILSSNGFSGADIMLDDLPEPVSWASTIVATAVEPLISPRVVEPTQRPCIYLVHLENPSQLSNEILSQLQAIEIDGISVSLVDVLNVNLPNNSRIISLVDINGFTLNGVVDHEFQGAKELLMRAATLLWVSSGDLLNASRPTASLIQGLITTVAIERPTARYAALDLEADFDLSVIDIARQIIRQERMLHQDNKFGTRDTEFIMHRGCVHISRIVPDSNLNERFKIQEALNHVTQLSPLNELRPVKISYERPGIPSSLYFKSDETFDQTLPVDSVELKIMAIGLNVHVSLAPVTRTEQNLTGFTQDIAVANGRFDSEYSSLDCSGVVQKVGSDVKDFRPGDPVFGFSPGKLGNFVRTSASFIRRIPTANTYAEMASLPISYLTAIYGLIHLGRLGKGDKVLIQSATGGLGLAALRIARHLEAEVYTTVGTSDKARFLNERFGIPNDHIFSSRELSTDREVMEATNGRGMDVILCSAAGEHMHETWRCIAPLGRFIEVGRTDIHGHGRLSMEVFQRNATFSSFDIELLFRQNPEYGARYVSCLVKPLSPLLS